MTGNTGKLDTRFPDGLNRMSNSGVYFSHKWKINERLTLTDGIRGGYSTIHSTLVDLQTQFNLPYSEISQKTPALSGSVGLISSPSDELKYSFIVSTGYRVPNLDDLSKIFAPSPGTVIVPNINLKPEETINYEFGLTKVFNRNTRWENSVYYTQFIDIVETASARFNGNDSIMYDGFMCKVVSNQNKGKAFIYGISSNLTSFLSNNLNMSMMVNYNYGRLKTGSTKSPLGQINPLMARFQIAYQTAKTGAEFFINYNGWKRIADYYVEPGGEDNQAYATPAGMPAWFTLNLRGSYKLNKYISLQAGIDNILDTQYRTFASGINAPGRNLFIAIRGNL